MTKSSIAPHQIAKGLTFQVVVGAWAKPSINFTKLIPIRICIGFIAFSIISKDMEVFLVEILKANRKEISALKQEIETLKSK